MFCLGCDLLIRGTSLSFKTWFPLCSSCADELEGLEQSAALRDERRARWAERRRRVVGWLRRLFA